MSRGYLMTYRGYRIYDTYEGYIVYSQKGYSFSSKWGLPIVKSLIDDLADKEAEQCA